MADPTNPTNPPAPATPTAPDPRDQAIHQAMVERLRAVALPLAAARPKA
jgi:hypothetical protein